MRKHLRDMARARLKTMGVPNKGMKKLWRDVLWGELAAKGHENQMKAGRIYRRELAEKKARKEKELMERKMRRKAQ